MDAAELHIPVMLERCLELLAPAIGRPGAVVVDGTLGLGGHAEAMLERFPGLTLVGLDRDPEALRLAGERLGRFGDRFRPVHTTYDGVDRAIAELGFDHVDGALYDLGVSSMQLDLPERGFSYSKNAPLDMRMDTTADFTAERIIAEYPEAELRRIFREYGEERLAQRYASRIVAERAKHPITTTAELVDILQAATPAALSNQGHPAKRVFQALRIEVNQELAVLERAIPRAIDALGIGGRLVVMSYQSLEDRIVKKIFQARSRSTAPAGLPVELPEHRPELALLTRGAELASDDEKARNPRSAPVRLRAVERVRRAA
ncbi:16S rRNA (cytosine(1402)-N(4))-methyltransferase RsmH [Gryllotalpicola reticulitermitis]|uniref:Ribosomal RNA small subunit methyltransferase H n=1 Tax=Gryllotalpicola reticulitermitis TaxID=1184153 RepID=A0ABV8QBI4_9MICO